MWSEWEYRIHNHHNHCSPVWGVSSIDATARYTLYIRALGLRCSVKTMVKLSSRALCTCSFVLSLKHGHSFISCGLLTPVSYCSCWFACIRASVLIITILSVWLVDSPVLFGSRKKNWFSGWVCLHFLVKVLGWMRRSVFLPHLHLDLFCPPVWNHCPLNSDWLYSRVLLMNLPVWVGDLQVFMYSVWFS